MKHQMMVRVPFVCSLFIAVLVFFVTACGGQAEKPGATQPTQASQATQTPAQGMTPQSSAIESKTEENSPLSTSPISPTAGMTAKEATADIQGGETIALAPNKGLEKLKSYQMNFSFSFLGKEKEDQNGSVEMSMDVDNETKDMHATMSMKGKAFETTSLGMSSIEVFQIGQKAYMMMQLPGTESMQCLTTPSAKEIQPIKPEEMIGELKDAKLVKKGEEINGMVTDRYVIENGSKVFSEMESVETAQATIWVAQDGGYLVKLTAEATGKNIMPGTTGQPIEGTFTMIYELKNINQVAAIALPNACENAIQMPGLGGGTTSPTPSQ